MRTKDLWDSLLREVGTDASDSFFDHLSVLARVAGSGVSRFGRGIPPGFFDDAGVRLSDRMLGLRRRLGGSVTVVPVESVPVEAVEMAAHVAWEVFGLPVTILRSRPIWPASYDPRTMQAYAPSVLWLGRKLVPSGNVIVVTDLELVVDDEKDREKFSAVLGYGSMDEQVCVASTFGLGRADDHQAMARLFKVVVHEIGHTFGLQHHTPTRTDVQCVMNMVPGSDDRSGLDFLTTDFCALCLGDLRAGRSQYEQAAKNSTVGVPCPNGW